MRLWIRDESAPDAPGTLVPVKTDMPPRAIAEEQWEWDGPLVEFDAHCAATGAFLRIGVRRVRTVLTHEPMAHFGDRAFGLCQVLLALPY